MLELEEACLFSGVFEELDDDEDGDDDDDEDDGDDDDDPHP